MKYFFSWLQWIWMQRRILSVNSTGISRLIPWRRGMTTLVSIKSLRPSRSCTTRCISRTFLTSQQIQKWCSVAMFPCAIHTTKQIKPHTSSRLKQYVQGKTMGWLRSTAIISAQHPGSIAPAEMPKDLAPLRVAVASKFTAISGLFFARTPRLPVLRRWQYSSHRISSMRQMRALQSEPRVTLQNEYIKKRKEYNHWQITYLSLQ